jgi:RNA polymerase sigma factor (sigma-70 family)
MPGGDEGGREGQGTMSGIAANDVGLRADAVLVEAVRAGDRVAYGELWRRHAAAGSAYARALTGSFDPDDLVSESFEKILRAITAGGGPTGAFRSYLYTTIKNTAYSWQRSRREQQPLEDTQEQLPDERSAALLEALEGAPSVYAFNTLPPAWQEVLWYVDIEAMGASEVAVILGTTPAAIAMRTHRAREGLRQAWIQVQLNTVADGSEHQWVLERMGAYVRKGLARRDRNRVQKHLDGCTRCALVHTEAQQISSRLALVLVPAVTGLTGTGLAAWLAAHQAAPAAAAAGAPHGNPSAAAWRSRRSAYAAGGAAVITAAALLSWHAAASSRDTVIVAPSAPFVASSAPPTAAETPEAAPTRPTPTPTPPEPAAPGQQASPAPQRASLPAVVAPVLAVPGILSPVTGLLTRTTLLQLTGTATPGTTITVSSAGVQLGQATTAVDGAWAVTADISTLGDGPHSLTVASAHPGAQPTTASAAITVDRHVSIPAQLSATATSAGVVVSGLADPGSSVQVQGTNTRAVVVADAAGRWSTAPLTTLPAGYSTVTAVATDDAGNVSPPSAAIGVTVDAGVGGAGS